MDVVLGKRIVVQTFYFKAIISIFTNIFFFFRRNHDAFMVQTYWEE